MSNQDRGWAWMILFSSFIIKLLIGGIVFSHGILYLELLNEFKKDKSVTSWVGSMCVAVATGCAPISSVLIRKYGLRTVAIGGGLLSTIAYLSSAFVTSLYQLFFTFGIMGGLGVILLEMPAIIAIVENFEKKRSLAMGICCTGIGVGTLIYGQLSHYLIDKYGWRGYLIIESGIILNGVVCGAVLYPLKSTADDNAVFCKDIRIGESNNEFLPELVPLNKDISDLSCESEKGDLVFQSNCNQENDFDFPATKDISKTCAEKEPDCSLEKNDSISNHFNILTIPTVNKDIEATDRAQVQMRNESSIKRWFTTLRNHITDVQFLLLCFSSFFCSLSYMIPFVFIPDLMVSKGLTRTDSAIVISAMGIANTTCRPIIGFIGDRGFLKRHRLIVYSMSRILCGVVLCVMPFCGSIYMFVASGVVHCLFLAAWIVCDVLVVADVFGDDLVNEIYGVICLVATTPALVGGPVCGWLYDTFGKYEVPFLTAGTCYIIGGSLALLVPVYLKARCRQGR